MKLIVKSPVWDDLREIALRIAQDNPHKDELQILAVFHGARGLSNIMTKRLG
jgi:hypothetical protein